MRVFLWQPKPEGERLRPRAGLTEYGGLKCDDGLDAAGPGERTVIRILPGKCRFELRQDHAEGRTASGMDQSDDVLAVQGTRSAFTGATILATERSRLSRGKSMSKPRDIELGDGTRIPILYEDRTVLAIDKPAGWLLVPVHWRQTSRNLQAALESGLAAGAFWARSRNLRFLRFVHRLDAETSGVLLLARSPGAMGPLSALFEGRQMEKRYLAVVRGALRQRRWTCCLPLAEDPAEPGRVRVDPRAGRPAETMFDWLASRVDPREGPVSLVEARPLTGRTHQIRVHLAAEGHAVVGDTLYGEPGRGGGAVERNAAGERCRRDARTTRMEEESRRDARTTRREEESGRDARTTGPGHRATGRTGRQTGWEATLGLRAAALIYQDPFTRRLVRIQAPCAGFLQAFGFAADADRRAA